MQRYSKQRHVLQPVSGCVARYANSFICSTRECQVNHWKNGDPPHKAVCGSPKRRSAALLKQIAKLEQEPTVEYYLMPPAPLPEVGLMFGGEAHRAKIFQELRNLAFEKGDKTSVALMYEFLDSEVKTTPAVAWMGGIDAQITEEFGFTIEEIQEELKVIDRFWDNMGPR
jgi:hypothetical protein